MCLPSSQAEIPSNAVNASVGVPEPWNLLSDDTAAKPSGYREMLQKRGQTAMTRAKVAQTTDWGQHAKLEMGIQRTLANPLGLADLLPAKKLEDSLDRQGAHEQFRAMPTPLRDHTYSRHSDTDGPKHFCGVPQTQTPNVVTLAKAIPSSGLEPWEAQDESGQAQQNTYRDSLRRQGQQAMQRSQIHQTTSSVAVSPMDFAHTNMSGGANLSADISPLVPSFGSATAEKGADFMVSSPSRLPPGLSAQEDAAGKSPDYLEFLCSSPSRLPPGLDAPQASPRTYRAHLQMNGVRILQRSPVKKPQHGSEHELASTHDTISESPRTSCVASEEYEPSRGSRTSPRACLTYSDALADQDQPEKQMSSHAWQRYVDPTTGKNWWHHTDGDFFFEEAAACVCHSECGKWQRFKDSDSERYWWWHKERNESFYEPPEANIDRSDV